MSIITKKISQVDLRENASWENGAFLTLDIDWAPDEVVKDSLALIGKRNATYFVTHNSSTTQLLKQYSNIELGIHPNFNPSLNGEANSSADDILDRLLEIAPNAKAIRGHSLTQSSFLLEKYKKLGLTYECSDYLPHGDWPQVRPWRAMNGIIKVPHTWEDDIALMDKAIDVDIKEIVKRSGVVVFDFHPIHIFLNTCSFEHYSKAKSFYQNPVELLKHRNTTTRGVRDVFMDLLSVLT
jgi:hypothetical protein